MSTGSTADGSAALPSSGVDRPSLFSTFPGTFSPFSAVNQIGALGGVSSGYLQDTDFDSDGQC